VQEMKDSQMGNIHQHIKPSMLNNRVSPNNSIVTSFNGKQNYTKSNKEVPPNNSIVTAFNGKQDYTKPNKEVPPKDAQLLEGPNQRYEHTT
jgi:hypothetical protein